MLRRITTAALIITCAMTIAPVSALASHDRHRVYVFSIDGLDGDFIGGPAMPFLNSLVAGNGANTTYFPNSSSVMFSETNPNHTAMITGAYPNRSGITSNEYAIYRDIANDDSCNQPKAARSAVPNVTSGEDNTCVLVPNAFETIQRQKKDHHITTAMIMGKPKLGQMFATSRARGTGQADDPIGDYDADWLWAPCRSKPAPYCDPSVPKQPVFDYSAADSYVMDEVIRTVNEGVMDSGKMRQPDFTFVNFPQVDSAGHVFNRDSAEYMAAAVAIDVELRRFVTNQKARGLWERTIMLVVSDHSMANTPNLTKLHLEDELDDADVPGDRYKISAQAGNQAHFFLNPRNAPGEGALLKQMRDALLAVDGVDEVLYRRANPVDGGKQHTVRTTHRDWHLWGPRAGDLLLTADPGIGIYDMSEVGTLAFNPLEGGHGAVFAADNTFIVTGGNAAIRQGTSAAAVSNVDAYSIAMKLLSRKPARTSQGKFRWAAFKRAELKK